MGKDVSVTEAEFGRRSVMKAAAWSVPVLATAVAVPAFAQTLPPGQDVRVAAYCDGQYDIASLQSLLAGVSVVGLPVGLTLSVLTDLVKAALAALGFREGATRRFEISAAAGAPIPAGVSFQLATSPPALIDLTALQGLLAVQALFIADVNGSGFKLTTTTALTAAPQTIELQSLLLDADVATQTSLTLLDDDGSAPGEAPDYGAFNTLAGAYVDLGELDLGAQLETVLPGTLNAVLRGLIRAVLGLTGGLTRLDGLSLRVQLCQA